MRSLQELCDTDIRAVRPVGSSERVIDEDVRQGCELFGEFFSVLCLLLAITGILEQDDISVLHRFNRCLCIWPDNIVISCELYFLAQKLGQSGSDRRQCLGRLVLIGLDLAQMRAQNYLSAIGNQLLNRRERSHQAVLVRDLSILQRNVEVTAAQDSEALHINVVNGFLVQSHILFPPVWIILSSGKKGPVLYRPDPL